MIYNIYLDVNEKRIVQIYMYLNTVLSQLAEEGNVYIIFKTQTAMIAIIKHGYLF